MDLASTGDDQETTATTLLNAVTSGRLEEELARVAASGASYFAEFTEKASRNPSSFNNPQESKSSNGGNDEDENHSASCGRISGQSIFHKTVLSHPHDISLLCLAAVPCL